MTTCVKDIMTKDCHCVKETETVQQAAEKMASLHIGSLPICGEDDKLKGMITDRDIVVSVVAKGRDTSSCPVSELESGNVIWISDTASLEEARQMMEENAVRRLPVICDHRLVGIVSQGDLACAMDNADTGQLVSSISEAPDNSGS